MTWDLTATRILPFWRNGLEVSLEEDEIREKIRNISANTTKYTICNLNYCSNQVIEIEIILKILSYSWPRITKLGILLHLMFPS